METETTVLLVDDHALLREGLRLVLESQSDLRVVGEAEDGRQAVALVEELQPDVVVMDIAMPTLNGIEATGQIARRHPRVKLVVLTMHDDQEYMRQAVKAGAIGYVLKSAAGKELVRAVRAASKGESYFSPGITGRLLDQYRTWLEERPVDMGPHLTDREREVLRLIAAGRHNQEMAEELGLSIKTVQTHRAHLMRKLGVHDRTGLIRYAASKHLVSLN